MLSRFTTHLTSRLTTWTAAAVLGCTLPAVGLAERQYEVTELPAPPAATGINHVVWAGDGGSTAGAVNQIPDNPLANPVSMICYLFDGAQFQILKPPTQQTNCSTFSANTNGDLVGQLVDLTRMPAAQNIAPGVAFVYRDGRFTTLADTLPPPHQVINSTATGINTRGDVVGFALWQDPRTQDAGVDGWIVHDGNLQTLPGLGGHSTRPNAVNDLGDIAADALTPPGPGQQQHAVLISRDGRLTDLGTLGGPTSSAAGINVLGQVVGYSVMSSDPNAPRVAFFHNGTAMLPIAVDQATRGAAAISLNDSGEVVGAYFITDDKGLELPRAFYYFEDKAVPLDSLVVDGPPDVTLIYPTRIYNDGRVICFGVVDGENVTRSYLLTPVEDTPQGGSDRRHWRRR